MENNTKYYFIILFDFSTHFRKKDLLFQYSFVVILFYVLNIVLKNETAETSMSLAMLVIVLLACFIEPWNIAIKYVWDKYSL